MSETLYKEIIGKGWSFPPRFNNRGWIALTNSKDEISQAIQIILSTAPGERVMRPTFGCRLHELIFAPNNSQTAAQARRFVEQALGMWEPRIKVIAVQVRMDSDRDSCLLIEIEYQVKSTHDKRSLVFPFFLIPEE